MYISRHREEGPWIELQNECELTFTLEHTFYLLTVLVIVLIWICSLRCEGTYHTSSEHVGQTLSFPQEENNLSH